MGLLGTAGFGEAPFLTETVWPYGSWAHLDLLLLFEDDLDCLGVLVCWGIGLVLKLLLAYTCHLLTSFQFFCAVIRVHNLERLHLVLLCFLLLDQSTLVASLTFGVQGAAVCFMTLAMWALSLPLVHMPIFLGTLPQ